MHSKTEVILIRHGETEWNLSGRWQGHADSPLSNRGVEQAKALGQRMKGETIDCFYSSDLERARHTSRLVGGPSGWEAGIYGIITGERSGSFRRDDHG